MRKGILFILGFLTNLSALGVLASEEAKDCRQLVEISPGTIRLTTDDVITCLRIDEFGIHNHEGFSGLGNQLNVKVKNECAFSVLLEGDFEEAKNCTNSDSICQASIELLPQKHLTLILPGMGRNSSLTREQVDEGLESYTAEVLSARFRVQHEKNISMFELNLYKPYTLVNTSKCYDRGCQCIGTTAHQHLLFILGLGLFVLIAWRFRKTWKQTALTSHIYGLVCIFIFGFSFLNPASMAEACSLAPTEFEYDQFQIALDDSFRCLSISDPIASYSRSENNEELIIISITNLCSFAVDVKLNGPAETSVTCGGDSNSESCANTGSSFMLRPAYFLEAEFEPNPIIVTLPPFDEKSDTFAQLLLTSNEKEGDSITSTLGLALLGGRFTPPPSGGGGCPDGCSCLHPSSVSIGSSLLIFTLLILVLRKATLAKIL